MSASSARRCRWRTLALCFWRVCLVQGGFAEATVLCKFVQNFYANWQLSRALIFCGCWKYVWHVADLLTAFVSSPRCLRMQWCDQDLEFILTIAKNNIPPPCFLLNCCYSPPDHRNRCSWKTQALQATYPTGLRVRWIIESPGTTGGLVWVLSWQTQQVTSVVIVPRFYCPPQLSWRYLLKNLALSTSIWMLLLIALWDVVSTWSINRTARWSFCLLSTRFYLVFTLYILSTRFCLLFTRFYLLSTRLLVFTFAYSLYLLCSCLLLTFCLVVYSFFNFVLVVYSFYLLFTRLLVFTFFYLLVSKIHYERHGGQEQDPESGQSAALLQRAARSGRR